MTRWTLPVFLLAMACNDDGEDTALECDEECADFYTMRAIDDYYTTVWEQVLSTSKSPFDLEIPCVEGTTQAVGTSEELKTGGNEVDVTFGHSACRHNQPVSGGGYELTITGSVVWEGTWDSTGTARTFTYRSSEIVYEGVVNKETLATEVAGTCTVQVALTGTSTVPYGFAGTFCGRNVISPTSAEAATTP